MKESDDALDLPKMEAAIWDALMKYHRELFVPDFERIVGQSCDRMILSLDGFKARVDETCVQVDRLIEGAQELRAITERIGDQSKR